ncbi:MAG: diaminopimelate epimerase [Candidatus Omnitrophica bacterium]|nr:diaminopimelate epimerase [Candidatus Omnitrophota bacterium]
MRASVISFYKMEASANDFIVVDNRKKAVRDPRKFAVRFCERHIGVGGDGVLLVEPSRRARFKMRILNADGSEAEMCGNGSRCVALFAHKVLRLPAKFEMETLAGIIGAEVRGETVKVRLSDPKDYRESFFLDVSGKPYPFNFINTGVPHAVHFVPQLASVDVDRLGAAVRHHAHFKPAGTNVNFVEVTGGDSISVRTYERGVGETQACGTGVTASALVSALTGRVKPPVKVRTFGGEILTVYFLLNGRSAGEVHLEGRARFVFKGEVTR